MGITTPTDGGDGGNLTGIDKQQKTTQGIIGEVLYQEKNNVNRLKAIGITINGKDKEKINGMDITDTQMENLRRIKKSGIYIHPEDIEDIKTITLTDTEIENVKKIKKIGGVLIDSKDIKALKEVELTEINLRKIEKLKFLIRNYRDIKNIKELTDKQIENIIEIHEMQILVFRDDVKYIKDLTDKEIKNIRAIKKLSINIRTEDIKSIKDVTNNDLKHIEELKKIIGYSREIKYIKGLTEKETKNIINIIEQGIQINTEDIQFIKDIELTDKEIIIAKNLNEKGVKLGTNELKIIRENTETLITNIKNIYEGLNYTPEQIDVHQYYTKGKIVENIQQYIQNTIKENRDIKTHEIIDTIKEDLSIISQTERMIIISKIYIIVEKFNSVRKYLDFKNGPYKTPKELLCAMKGIDNSKINDVTDDITVRQHGAGLIFFVGDKKTYEKIGIKGSSGCYIGKCAIPDLDQTLLIVNGKDPGENMDEDTYDTIRHEGQHNWNSYFMPDMGNGIISLTKDEIIAYIRGLKNGNAKEREIPDILVELIKNILSEGENEGGLYQYIKGEERENHKKQIKKLLTYVNDILKLAKCPNSGLGENEVISMLAITPVNKREKLHKIIIKTNESIIQKMKEEEQDDGVVL